MNPCDYFRALIDRPSGPEEREQIELLQHLEGCPDCSAYRHEADRTTELLKNLQTLIDQAPPADRSYQKIAKRAAESRQQAVVALLGLAILLACLAWFVAQGAVAAIVILAGYALVLAWRLRQTSRKARRYLSAAANQTGDFLAAWQKDLRFEMRVITIGGLDVFAESTIITAAIFLSVGRFDTGVAVVLTVALLANAYALYQYLFELPLLKNELAMIQDGAQ